MPVTTNTRKLAALLGASGAGIGTDGLLQAAGVDANLATQAEIDLKSNNTDLVNVRSDISTVALRQAIGDNHVAYNLPNSFVDQFQDGSGIGSESGGNRNALEYWSSESTIAEHANDGNTKLLLHMNGSNAGQVFTDSSTSPHTMVRTSQLNGHPTTQTAIKKFGTASAYFGNGTGAAGSHGNSLYAADSADWNFQSAAFTLEAWIYKLTDATVGNSSMAIFGQANSNTSDVGGSWHFNTSTTGKLHFNTYQRNGSNMTGNFSHTSTQSLLNNTWYHVAVTRDGDTIRMYINGVQERADALSGGGAFVVNDLGGRLYISKRAYNNSYGYFRGYMDEMRISNVCRYPAGRVFSPNQVTNATGTLIGTANVPSTAQTKVSGVLLYKDFNGTATLGTDLIIYVTCNGGTNWTQLAAGDMTTITPVFSTGIKMVKLAEKTCTSGSDVRYKAVFANQSAAKMTQLHGIGLNY
jgi:hypothetical protein